MCDAIRPRSACPTTVGQRAAGVHASSGTIAALYCGVNHRNRWYRWLDMDKQIAVRIPMKTYAAIIKEVVDVKKRTGIHTSVSAIVRAAIEQRYAKKGGA